MTFSETNPATIEEQFKLALNHCSSLATQMSQPSEDPCKAIQLLCKIAVNPFLLTDLLRRNVWQVAEADQVTSEYASSIDNWKSSDCQLGIADQCNILHFFLNLHKSYQDLLFFRGNDLTPELICQFLKEWKKIDLVEIVCKLQETSQSSKSKIFRINDVAYPSTLKISRVDKNDRLNIKKNKGNSSHFK